MAPRIGTTLVRCALGPVNYAGSLIMASRIPDGLRELSAESLHGGLIRGIAETARLVGMQPSEIEKLLPSYEIRAAVTNLTASQKAAVEAWDRHAGQIGGLLQGVADLTVDGKVPDVPLCLSRLAQRVSRDKAFAEPLQALSGDIARWQEVVNHCRGILDDGGALARAYRMRKIRTVAIGVALGLAISGVAFIFIRIKNAHTRVEARLAAAAADPCSLMAVPESEVSGGTADQQKRVLEGRRACETRRAAEKQARAQQEKRDAEERVARETKQKREATCTALAAHLDAGQIAGDDAATAGAAAGLLGRVASKRLDEGDLGPDEPKLPCEDVPAAAKKIRDAFAAAIILSRWIVAPELSGAARAALAANASAIRDTQKQIFMKRADATAKRGIMSGDPAMLESARKLCQLARDLGAEGRGFCPAALGLK